MPAPNEPWMDALRQAAASAAGRTLGLENVEHRWHARLVETALLAFGDDPRAAFYVETLPPRGRVPRPDLILCHPQVGCLVVENKGVALEAIEGVEGTSLVLRRDGGLRREDPFLQAEKVEFRLKDLLEKRLRRGRPLFAGAAALPRVGREAFARRFGQEWPPHTLFADAFASPETFRRQVLSITARARERARRKVVWFANGAEELHRIVAGTTPLTAARPTRLEDRGAAPGDGGGGAELLGLSLERAGLEDALPTSQQHEIARRDLRGAHWLFRGVAGSGKTVMLAMSAARTLYELTTQTRPDPSPAAGPAPRVLICCYNKSLLPFLRERVEERYARLAYDAPPPGSLEVVNVDKLTCDLERSDAALATGRPLGEKAARLNDLFDALPEARRRALQYDAVYVDEAQDLTPDQVRLLRRLARAAAGRLGTLVIFYDNAQNIYGKPTPVWDDLGVKIVGRTTFLDRCFRNTRQTLEPAFNVLVGGFAGEGERAGTRRFADVASLRERGLVEERQGRFRVRFADRPDGPPPRVRLFADRRAEAAGAAAEVRDLVAARGVLPSDVLVLARSLRDYPGLDEQLREALGPNVAVRAVGPGRHEENKRLAVVEDGVLTLSTVASAKGYDAAMVLLLGCDRFETDPKGRATFYVGATRAKHQLVLTAVEPAGGGDAAGARQKAKSLLPEILAAVKAFA